MSLSYCDQIKVTSTYDVIYCEVFEEDSYDQVWIISGAFMLISLGITFSNFTQFANIMGTLSKIIARARQGDDTMTEDEVANQLLDTNNVAGYTISQYIVLQSLLILIYFCSKILLITDESLSDANEMYESDSWRHWITAHNLLTMYIFTASTTTSNNMMKLVKQVQTMGKGDEIHIIAKFLCIIFVTDMIGSFVMICIKYGYILLFLYYMAVAMLCGFMLALTVCCWGPLIFGVSLVLQTIFKSFACGNENCVVLFNGLAHAIALNGLFYFVVILVLVFMWLFVGGPTDDIVVLYDRSNEIDVLWCLVVSCVYGFIVMLGGFVRASTLNNLQSV